MTHDEPGSDEPNAETETTVAQVEERSNRNSWRIMYVFIAIIVVLFGLGFVAMATQSGS